MKFAETLCERAADDAAHAGDSAAYAGGGSGHVPGWMRILSARTAPGSSPERRLRSRSSPVRSLARMDAPACEQHNDPTCEATAFYSLCPPALPMRLVAVSPPPGGTRALPATLLSTPLTSMPIPPGTTLVSPPLDEESCKNAVRSVLWELLAVLPLSSPSSPGRSTPPQIPHRTYSPRLPRRRRHMYTARYARLPRSAAFPRRPRMPHLPHHAVPLVPSAHDDFYSDSQDQKTHLGGLARSVGTLASPASTGSAGSATLDWCDCGTRNVATQAHAPRNVQRVDCRPDEWLGGVRALRDSHVRLVLRQLRHIERLNRALDRLPPPAAPAPPPRTPHVSSLMHP